MIVHVDMDAFFASVEQVRHPHLHNKAVVIRSNPKSKTVIAASYEARAFGASVGKPAPNHPDIHTIYSDLDFYATISQIIMRVLQDICPCIEVFSIDEAFLDFTGMQYVYTSEKIIINTIKDGIKKATRLNCSVGIAENKSLAKVASQKNKPNGYLVIPPGTGKDFLKNQPISILCGIGPKIERFLNQQSVYMCQDINRIPISLLSSRFGQLGREIWHMCQGNGSATLHPPSQYPKSMGNSKCIEPRIYHPQELVPLYDRLCQKLCKRLRDKSCFAQSFTLSLVTSRDHLTYAIKPPAETHYQSALKPYYRAILSNLPDSIFVRRIAIRTADLRPTQQSDLLAQHDDYYEDVMDAVQKRFGDNLLIFCHDLIGTS